MSYTLASVFARQYRQKTIQKERESLKMEKITDGILIVFAASLNGIGGYFTRQHLALQKVGLGLGKLALVAWQMKGGKLDL